MAADAAIVRRGPNNQPSAMKSKFHHEACDQAPGVIPSASYKVMPAGCGWDGESSVPIACATLPAIWIPCSAPNIGRATP